MSVEEFRDLVGIAEAIDQAARGRLARAATLARQIQDEVARLDAEQRHAGSVTVVTPGALQAADRHRRWIEGQKRAALSRLAAMRAETEAARLHAAAAFGRLTALRELEAEARADRRRDRQRRAQATDPGRAAMPRRPADGAA